MKRVLSLFLALLCALTVLPVTTVSAEEEYTFLQFKYSDTFDCLNDPPAYLAEATEVFFADQWQSLGDPSDPGLGTTNARRNLDGNFADQYYVYLKDDKRGDFTISFEIEEEGWYNFGMKLFVLSTGTTRSTYLQIDDSMNIDIRFTNAAEEMYHLQYVSGLMAYMTEGKHTATICLTEDFDNATVKSLFFRSLLFQKTTEDFKYHIFGDWETLTEPTCTEEGLAEHKCTVCGETEQKVLKATGHTAKTTKATPATCTEDGLKAGKVCSVCGTVIKEQEVIPATGHNFGEWKITVQPTAENEGLKTRECKNCDETETEVIPKTDAPTVTEMPTDTPSAEPTTLPADTDDGKFPLVFLLAIAAALLAALACAYFFVLKKKKKK